MRVVLFLIAASIVALGCSDDSTPAVDNEDFPVVLAAEATLADDGTWRVSVTISSPYDSPERYADAWRVVGPDGVEFGLRVLAHDHASEQPFTRSLAGIAIPEGMATVTIEARDLVNGWNGQAFELQLETT